jgi:hypothetical protein
MGDDVEYPKDPLDPEFIMKFLKASNEAHKKEPLKDVYEILEFFKAKYPGELLYARAVVGG